MNYISVKVKSNRKINIDKRVFLKLFNISHIKELKDYQNAISNSTISFKILKKLSFKAAVPYPLFFAPLEIVELQIADKNRHIYSKIPSKEDFSFATRGKVAVEDIELLLKDLTRKQDFLKTRILKNVTDNLFIGSISLMLKENIAIESIAEYIRNYFKINLDYLRLLNKKGVLEYLVRLVEDKNIYIALSSFNYMPQNVPPELEMSGICIKDKKFPFIFINTRDGESNPKIIESSGRQVFTLLAMLVCIGMKHFILSSTITNSKNDPAKIAYSIAGEIIVPLTHLKSIKIENLEDLKTNSEFFKVTPSMLLYRLTQTGSLPKELIDTWRQALVLEVKKRTTNIRASLPVNAYAKYNGKRFSKEVIKAYNKGAISATEVKNILFRTGKIDNTLFTNYQKIYG